MRNKFLVLIITFLVLLSGTASASSELRTLGRPLLRNKEMTMVPVNGTCSTSTGCYEIRNTTDRWIVPGNSGPGAAPGRALLMDSAESMIPTGLYLGPHVIVGAWYDEFLGVTMPMIDGQFVSAIAPGASAYVSVSPGVNSVLAWSLSFEPEFNAVATDVFDVRLNRVVNITPGETERVPEADCRVYNNPYVETSSPELAMVRTGDCYH